MEATHYFYPNAKFCSSEPPAPISLFEINVGNSKQCSFRPQVFFVVDVSGSMSFGEHILDHRVKPTLVALGDLFCGFKGADDDNILSEKVDLTLVTFANDAKIEWSTKTKNSRSYRETVMSLQGGGMTNMGEGIEKVYQVIDPNVPSWILVFTDGDSNLGEYRTSDEFKRLASGAPKMSRILVFGYGENYKAETCYSLGSFTHINDGNEIPVAMGAVAGEILGTWGVNATIVSSGGVKIVGSSLVGPLYSGRKFYCAFVNPSRDDLIHVPYITYYDPQDKLEKIVPFTTTVVSDDALPSHVKSLYYKDRASEYILSLLTARSRDVSITSEIAAVRNAIQGWTEYCASEAKAKVEEAIHVIERNREHPPSATSRAFSYAGTASSQGGYTDLATLTPLQQHSVAYASSASNNSSMYSPY